MRVISLEYHDVVYNGEYDFSGFSGNGPASYKLDYINFREHINEISKALNKNTVVKVDLNNLSLLDNNSILTFDDGGKSALSIIADILEDKGWYGHFMIATDYIGQASFLSKNDILKLYQRGHVIGAHSASHPAMMGKCSWKELIYEWDASTKILSDIIGEYVFTGSVPGGFYKRNIAKAAVEAGIKVLFTSEPISRCIYYQDCLIIGRYTMRRWTKKETASAIIKGKIIPRFHQRLIFSIIKMVRNLGGSVYTNARNYYWEKSVKVHKKKN